MFREVRRQNRILENSERIDELLLESEYGFLSVGSTDNGYAYGIPINYAFDKESNALYFHCAMEGQKLDSMHTNNKVSFCVVGTTEPMASQFSTRYESIIVFGQANLSISDDDKRKCLRLLIKKYSPGHEETGEKYMEKSWNKTYCFKINIEHITAKARY